MSAVKLMLMGFVSVMLVACDHMNIAKLNERVSPGAVTYGHSKSGKQMVSAIKERGLVPRSLINQKNGFL